MNTKKYGIKEMVDAVGPITFGNALEAHRKCEELSAKEFALFLGISPSSLCDLEKGRSIPSPKRAANIGRKLGEPEGYWIQLAIQDMLRVANLDYKVSIA